MSSNAIPTSRKMRICGDPADMGAVRGQVIEFSKAIGFAGTDASRIALAVDEALANVIKHSYGGSCGDPIDIELMDGGQSGRAGIRITVRDYGKKVDPSAIRGRELENVRPGGLGVHIIRTVMDTVDYRDADGAGMILTMCKQASAAG